MGSNVFQPGIKNKGRYEKRKYSCHLREKGEKERGLLSLEITWELYLVSELLK